MTPTRTDVENFNKGQWLNFATTNNFIKSLESARSTILTEVEDLADSIGDSKTQLINNKLVQAKTLRKIIEYAQKTDSHKFNA